MAKTLIVIFIVLVVGMVVYMAYTRGTKPFATYETRTVQIGNTELDVFIADTSAKRAQGLMGVTELETTGMLFIFPDTEQRTFWNKNTLLDLDIIWVAGGHIVGISSLPAVTKSRDVVRVSSPVPAQEVIEVNAGWVSEHGVKVGDIIRVK